LLALDVDPVGAIRNLNTMDDMGWRGNYGFYEAADFSVRGRWPWQAKYRLVRCWMAHHQGMSLLALCNFLNANVVQKWFHAERRVQATELLLHEKRRRGCLIGVLSRVAGDPFLHELPDHKDHAPRLRAGSRSST
jgi:hypothetical protein